MIVVSQKAKHDLAQWIDWINQDNPAAARDFESRIDRVIQMIDRHPLSGHRHPSKKDIRYVVEAPLKIFYSYDTNTIRVLRFWHTARNPRSIRYRDRS
jgi:plasmid stabilization system protein ParE